jgi:hypothetical protein
VKLTDEIKNVPLTIFAFFLAVLYVVASRSLTWQSSSLLLGILFLHFALKFFEIKEKQSKLLNDVNIYLKNIENELTSQRTDISKLNLLFGINQNMTKSPSNAFMSPGFRDLAQEQSNLNKQESAWTPKKK